MRDTFVCREEITVEDLAGVGPGEMGRFGDGLEALDSGCAVDREIINWFVRNRSEGGVEGGCGEHGLHRTSVGEGEGAILWKYVRKCCL